ncbi:MAG: Trk system potassium transporter TrkA [Lachnospiraceae bacterium]|nr:Trk system potassium transporter TrkA [Lachnospiraceae bacterium]
MKIVIAGCGKVGTALAEHLCEENHDIIVIDPVESRLNYLAKKQDVMCMVGDAKSTEVLGSADIEHTDLMLAMTADDEENLIICLIASQMGCKNTIARVRNPVYDKTISVIRDTLGLSMTINPDYEAAREIFKSLRFKSAGQVETFAKGRTEILTCYVKEGTPICDVKIKDVYDVVKTHVFFCAVKRKEQVFIPDGDTIIQAGDTLSFVASREDADNFFKKLNYDTGRIRDLTIIGGGKLGYYLGKMAIEDGIMLKIVDSDPEKCRKLSSELKLANVICGDGMDTKLISEENILNSSAVACLTGNDATNTLISMYLSRNAGESKIISKIKKSDFEDMLFNLGYGSVYNAKYIAVDRIIRYVRAMGNAFEGEFQSLSHIIDNKVEVLEFIVHEDCPHIGEELKDIHFKKNLLIANVRRGGRTFVPGGSDSFEPGDTLLVVTTIQGISKFAEIFA